MNTGAEGTVTEAKATILLTAMEGGERNSFFSFDDIEHIHHDHAVLIL